MPSQLTSRTRASNCASPHTNRVPDPFDPAPFRRVARLQRLLEAVQSGVEVDPDAGADPETRAINAETVKLVAARLPESPTVEEEDAIIRWAYKVARRKVKRRRAGGTWAE